ncbi:MAG: hypothetical protein Aureis2KO_21100 [Aureisphaera sp.]
MVSLVAFVIIAFSGFRENKMVLWYSLFYTLSSVLTLWYENNAIATWSMILNGSSFLFLIVLVVGKLEFKKPENLFLFSWIAVALINAWLMFMFLEILYEYISSLELFIAICFSCATFFILSVTTFLYNNEHNTRNSIVFIFFLVFLIFAEMFRGVGYYEFVDSINGQYFARFLLIISFTLLPRFTLLEVEGEKIL